ncbi:MAG: DUF4131 domain-containing protein [Gammaproteobacteria bacterium]|nr:DUF4131 domain-containing protein [Gammaproteobacteria bacterium]
MSLACYRPYPDHLRAGQRWQLTVKLKPLHGMINPGVFEYESWLFLQGIGATGYVKPHHGSNTSSATDFINAINPTVVLFPAAYLNRYRFPSKKVQKRYKNKNIVSYSTG